MALRLEQIEAGPLLEGVRERMAGAAALEERRVISDGGDGLALTGDRLRLEQALSNLADNAIRHGDGEVRIWAHAEDGRVRLGVSDDGAGFDAGYLPRAFERFSRGDPARTGDGAGLGLAIVAAIASAHGGEAGAANRPEGGSDAWIDLPGAPSS